MFGVRILTVHQPSMNNLLCPPQQICTSVLYQIVLRWNMQKLHPICASSLHWNILFIFCPLPTVEYNGDQVKIPFPQISPISGAQTIILYTLTLCSFVSHTSISKQFSPLFYSLKKLTFWIFELFCCDWLGRRIS